MMKLIFETRFSFDQHLFDVGWKPMFGIDARVDVPFAGHVLHHVSNKNL